METQDQVVQSIPDKVEVNGHIVECNSFRRLLQIWGRANMRSFPWRETNDPYKILVAEVMLHRTQAIQVVPTYLKFVSTYSTIASVHCATESELMEILRPLGLPQRVGPLVQMASDIVTKFGGQIPMAKNDLLSLAGISEYIASAVRCFAWNLPEAIIDTNTVRVTGRVFDMDIKDSSRRNHEYRRAISALVDSEEPKLYNYALLDLAAAICTKRKVPSCSDCPVLRHCVYGNRLVTSASDLL